MTIRDLTVKPLGGYPAAVGTALWTLEDTRRRTLEAIEGISPAELLAVPRHGENAIGSLLYHIAAIETDWLYAEILEREFPAWTAELLPFDVREEGGRLTPVPDMPPTEHLDRLATVRAHFLDEMRRVDAAEFDRPRDVDGALTTPRWVVHHLAQHEAEHRGQIQANRTALRLEREG